MPAMSNGFPRLRVDAAVRSRDGGAERVLDRVALRVARPDSARHRAWIAGSARHCLFSNGSYSCVPTRRVLLSRPLARVEHASALVDVVAHLE